MGEFRGVEEDDLCVGLRDRDESSDVDPLVYEGGLHLLQKGGDVEDQFVTDELHRARRVPGECCDEAFLCELVNAYPRFLEGIGGDELVDRPSDETVDSGLDRTGEQIRQGFIGNDHTDEPAGDLAGVNFVDNRVTDRVRHCLLDFWILCQGSDGIDVLLGVRDRLVTPVTNDGNRCQKSRDDEQQQGYVRATSPLLPSDRALGIGRRCSVRHAPEHRPVSGALCRTPRRSSIPPCREDQKCAADQVATGELSGNRRGESGHRDPSN